MHSYCTLCSFFSRYTAAALLTAGRKFSFSNLVLLNPLAVEDKTLVSSGIFYLLFMYSM
jgi:hypothetical protein